jgi:hypothetical protein
VTITLMSSFNTDEPYSHGSRLWTHLAYTIYILMYIGWIKHEPVIRESSFAPTEVGTASLVDAGSGEDNLMTSESKMTSPSKP